MGTSNNNLYQRGLKVVQARVGLLSNNLSLLDQPAYLDAELQESNPRIWPFLCSLYRAEEIPFDQNMDGYIYILDSKEAKPEITATSDRIYLAGDISGYDQELEANPSLKRYTLFGNGGILAKFAYTLMERKHDLLSFHATSLYDEARNEMYVIVGPPGAGKTVIMLEGCLRRRYKVFATEMTHVQFTDKGLTLYKGSLYDNIRLETVSELFPEINDVLEIKNKQPEKAGEAKICVSFAPLQTRDDVIHNPRMNWLFPRIESESSKAIFTDIKSESALAKLLYENASENIVRPRIYYSRLALSLIDYPESAHHRLELCRRLVRDADTMMITPLSRMPQGTLVSSFLSVCQRLPSRGEPPTEASTLSAGESRSNARCSSADRTPAR
jgi:hypothetical protein